MPRSTHLGRSTTLRLLGAAAVIAAVVPSTGAGAVYHKNVLINCPSSRAVNGGPGLWQAFRSPSFDTPVGLTVSQDIAAYAIDPKNPDRVVVTNGNSIYYSGTSGCAWQLALRLDEVPSDPQGMPLSGQFTRIVGLYIAPGGEMYATAEELETGATVGTPHVLRSDDGLTWTLGDDGLPPLGHPLTMRAAPTNANVMYLSFQNARDSATQTCPAPPLPCPGGGGTGRPLGLMWGSQDGGRTWTSRTDPSDVNGTYPIKFISVDDDDRTGRSLWVVANGLLRQSNDGGSTFHEPDGLDQKNFTFTAVESINHSPQAKDLRLVAFSGEGEMLRLNKNIWTRTKVPFMPVESVAQRPEGDIAVATAPVGGQVTIWRIFAQDFVDYADHVGQAGITFKTTYGWEQITPGTLLPEAAAMTSGFGGTNQAGTYFVRDQRRLLRFVMSTARDHASFAPPADIGAPPPPRGHITPSVLTLNLPIGKTKTIDYTLTLPPAPTPIDVFLLLDNSGSMQPLLDDLKVSMADVVRTLVRSGVDVQAGVGQINVQPETPPIDNPRTTDVDESKPIPLYQLLRRIGPVDGNFFRALSRVDGNGGAGDEAQLESLWQSVVGDGMSILGVPFLTGYSIPPHQQAGFRTGITSIKVIVHATDEKFSTNIKGSTAHNTPGPVGLQLRNAGIKQIGLSQGEVEARDDLSDMARRTGAVAPRGGTDCDGDGHADIPAGEALVCDQNSGLDKTLVNLLRSLNDPQVITLDTQPSITMRSISKTAWGIDAKQLTRRTFSMTYSCLHVPVGSYDNTVRAVLRGSNVATAVATVNCGGPNLVRERLAEVLLPPPNVQGPAPFPAPIAPVNPVAQGQTQVQTQINPQAGAATQEEEQLQVATADNDITDLDNNADELAMSAFDHRARWASPGLVLGTGLALTTALGCGVALRRRTRTQVARVPVR